MPKMFQPQDFGLTKAAYSVKETIETTSLGRTSIYAAVKNGRLRLTKSGKKSLILAPDLVNFLAGLRGEAHHA